MTLTQDDLFSDINFIYLKHINGSDQFTPVWEQKEHDAVALFPDGSEAARFVQRLHAAGAFQEYSDEHPGLTSTFEEALYKPGSGNAPFTVTLWLERLRTEALAHMLALQKAEEAPQDEPVQVSAPHAAAA